MKTVSQWKGAICSGGADATLLSLYGAAMTDKKARLLSLVEAFGAKYGEEREAMIFSVPGRSELAGNHTDHNHGCVIAGAIDLDMIAVAAPREDGVIYMQSEGFSPLTVTPDMTHAPDPARYGTSDALVAGMVNGLADAGYQVGGFDAMATSDVLRGSGLSSSAAYEVMIGTILNHLYNGGTIDAVTVAKLSQRAENLFFGKPCGLMDQCACAIGGMIAIDFADPTAPVVEAIPFDLTGAGYALCIVDTGGNHADLTPDYASVPAEMKAVAAALGKTVLRETDEASVLSNIETLRAACGDRAVLRALHFFSENRRVSEMRAALLAGNLKSYFEGVLSSGRSSFCYLQNVYTTANVTEQGLSLALCLCESSAAAAHRVHGGGFAGTIQAYVPHDGVESFCATMDPVFGAGACRVLHLRPVGAVCLDA
ncbi:MAG: galactokinase [Ruminococcaceae bacterium]|nr:galactokinase [Oscillospiraceae bacterium]